MKKIRLGIIGFGNMGNAYFDMIVDGKCPEIEVTAIAGRNIKRLEPAREKIKSIALFDDVEAMLDSGLIDAAIVAVTHFDHPKYAIECFKRGVHVIIEKPAGVHTKHVREMNEAAKKSNAVFGIMLNQRTDHVYRKMRELVQGGTLGNIRRTSMIVTNWYRPQAYYDSGSWRATWAGEGGGVLINQSPHHLDLWQWICGMPVKVLAKVHLGKWHDIEVEDDVTAYVEYANGATGTFVTSTGDAPGTNRFEITLDKGKLLNENGKLYLWELMQTEQEFSKINKEPFGQPEYMYSEVETDGVSKQHCGMLNAFAAAILRGEPLIASGEEGINALAISNAVHLSAWLGKEILLPFDDDLYYGELMKRVKTSKVKENVEPVLADVTSSYNLK